jgi:predicted PurR-regulated permease PerM
MVKKFTKDAPEMEVTVSTRTVLRVLILVFGAILLIAAIKQAQHALMLVFIAFFLALALNSPVHAIARRLPGKLKGRRAVATAVSFLVIVALFAGFMASIVPPLVRQTQGFIDTAPALLQDARSQDSDIGQFIRKYNLESQVEDLSGEIGSRLQGIGGSAFRTVGKVGSSIFAILTILVLTFMMLVEGPRALGFFKELVPNRRQADAERLTRDMYRVIKGYVNGQVTLAALAALVIVPALFILDISYPIALMVIVFICGLIPMVGHTIGAIIVSTVALFTSPLAALIILGYYILYQQIENYLIQPKVQSNSTNMSPLLVFISVVVGVSFGGLVGGLFAIPIAGCIRIFVLDLLIRHGHLSKKESLKAHEQAQDAWQQ